MDRPPTTPAKSRSRSKRTNGNDSIGTADTTIAYIEAGINWRDGSIAEGADKIFINRHELPRAACDPRRPDANKDGWFNALDVKDAIDTNGNGNLGPRQRVDRH